MRTQTNKIALFFLLSIFPAHSRAAEIARLDRSVVGFANNAVPGSVLLLSQDGQADWLKDARAERKQTYRIIDQACSPTSQNTTTMGSKGGLTLASPFLVGVGTACYIDEANKTIRLLSDFTKSLPTGAYSAVYAGADTVAAYFLINGRPFPDGTDGYLDLVTLDKRTLKVSVRELVKEVPGFSGAMVFDQDAVWVTSWPGSIYKVDLAALQGVIRAGGEVSFPKVAIQKFHDIDGMSLFLLANESSLLYDNGAYESYTVNRQSGARTIVKPSCTPIASYQTQWLVLCNGNTVETWVN
jgi:hypothetical protein